MRVDVLTLFPGMFQGPMTESMMWKARDRGLLDLHIHERIEEEVLARWLQRN